MGRDRATKRGCQRDRGTKVSGREGGGEGECQTDRGTMGRGRATKRGWERDRAGIVVSGRV